MRLSHLSTPTPGGVSFNLIDYYFVVKIPVQLMYELHPHCLLMLLDIPTCTKYQVIKEQPAMLHVQRTVPLLYQPSQSLSPYLCKASLYNTFTHALGLHLI